MFTDETVIYSKRYAHLHEESKQPTEKGMPPSKKETTNAEASLQKFRHRVNEESIYVPKPGREKESQRFITLAKELSDLYEVDIDVIQKSYFVEVDFHLYCSTYPSDFTRRLAELFNMCDRFCSFLFESEPSDFTLSLEFYTHDFYLSGKLMND